MSLTGDRSNKDDVPIRDPTLEPESHTSEYAVYSTQNYRYREKEILCHLRSAAVTHYILA